jgi:hypothetical protein
MMSIIITNLYCIVQAPGRQFVGGVLLDVDHVVVDVVMVVNIVHDVWCDIHV